MRFWFVHSGEVSLREQIATQVTLAAASGELRPGQRLPSTREMARRYGLHPNTVSAAYQQLQEQGVVEARHGAGVFLKGMLQTAPAAPGRWSALDRMIASFLTSARAQGYSREAVTERVRRWMEVRPPDHFLLVEPEDERREIVLAELQSVLRLPVRACGFEDCGEVTGAVALALPSKAAAARSLLPEPVELVTLQVTNVPAQMHEWLPVAPDALVGIVSRWPEFIRIARVMLVAAGFSADAMTTRVRGEAGWAEGLTTTAAVVCDAATAKVLPAKVRAVPFRLVSDATVSRLREMEEAIAASLEDPARQTQR